MSDLVFPYEIFITKNHFLCSVVLGTSEDSTATPTELAKMDCANFILFTDHWKESLA